MVLKFIVLFLVLNNFWYFFFFYKEYLRMGIVKEPKKKESNYKCTRREESRSQEGNLEKRATVVALRRQGRLRSISDQKSPRFSRVNKFLFQIGTKYSQNIFISRKYICIASKERAKESCPKYLNSCVDTI